MHRFLATYLAAFIFSWLLSLGSHVAWGYYPPLQATASYTTHSVTYSVYNPEKQQGYSATLFTLGTVVDLQQHNGVIAWVVQDGSSYGVGTTTFDPGLNSFQNDWKGPFVSLNNLTVKDGVVAYLAVTPPNDINPGYPGVVCSTYNPSMGSWRPGYIWYSFSDLATDFIVKDGVVLLRRTDVGSNDCFSSTIFDPKLDQWAGNGTTISPYPLAFINLTVSNATIYYEWQTFPWMQGYKGGGSWDDSPTSPMAYFVAQPKLGTSPMWVWFTDMSIAGANWNWNFDDNSGSTNRSPHHTFTSPGTFWVSQQINGPSFAFSQPIIVGNPIVLKGKSLPAILELLLLAD